MPGGIALSDASVVAKHHFGCACVALKMAQLGHIFVNKFATEAKVAVQIKTPSQICKQ